MNRIRKIDNNYQVLITPNITVSPDSSLLIGNWTDEGLRNYYVLQFESLNDAQAEAYKYADIDWYKIILNHKYIFIRLKNTIEKILKDHKYNVNIESVLLEPEVFKNLMFDRVANGGERFNLRQGMTDIISFTITNPWSVNLEHVSKTIENHREWIYRDDLRIRHKKILDGKTILLYGVTEFGTIYEIRLVPTLLNQWSKWYKTSGFRNKQAADELYTKFMGQQEIIDSGPMVI
jgi:hypothetical protein